MPKIRYKVTPRIGDYLLHYVQQGKRLYPCVTVETPALWQRTKSYIPRLVSRHSSLEEAFQAMARLNSRPLGGGNG